jgi:hypothetical protein
MTAFARRTGVGLDLLPDGFPAFGMACTLALGVLTEAEVAEFGRLFSPDMESAIPLL